MTLADLPLESDPQELSRALRKLGANPDHWTAHQSRPDSGIHLDEVKRILARYAPDHVVRLDEELRPLGRNDNLLSSFYLVAAADHVIANAAASPQMPDLLDLVRSSGGRWIGALLRHGDELAPDQPEAALSMYEWAVEDVPRPEVHCELGYLLLQRAAVHSLPLCEADFENEFLSLSQDDRTWTEGITPTARSVHEDRKIPLPSPVAVREGLLQLGVDSYARAYGYYLQWVPNHDPGPQRRHGAHIDWTDAWRQLLVLDGLRVTLMEQERFAAVELTCRVFYIWLETLLSSRHDRFSEQDWEGQLKERFASTAGFIAGRSVEAAIQEAIEETRRAVVVSDPDMFASRVADAVVRHLGPLSLMTRAQVEEQCSSGMGPTWGSWPASVQQFLIEGEWLKSLLEGADGHEYGPIVIEYARAVEAFLREISGSAEYNLSNFRGMFRDRQRVRITFLSKNAPVDELSRMIDRVTDERNKAAHGDPRSHRPFTRAGMMAVRELVLGDGKSSGLMALLSQHRKP